MNKYYSTLANIIANGQQQTNKKGEIHYLLNQQLDLRPGDLLDIFEGHSIARKKLKSELQLFMQGERLTERYREAGISWWDYCGPILVNSYPTYFEKLPRLIDKINAEKRSSKNYVLFLGETCAESNQAPCLSLVQFQIDNGELVVSAYQRSSDANLGLPSEKAVAHFSKTVIMIEANSQTDITAFCQKQGLFVQTWADDEAYHFIIMKPSKSSSWAYSS